MLKVDEIIKATKGKLINGDIDKRIYNYKLDSREIEKDDFYIPVIGEKVDGHKFIVDTITKGCIGFFVASSEIEKLDIKEFITINNNLIIIEVEDTLKALYDIGVYNRNKHLDIEVVAVTGSVGKTSTREMIASVLSEDKQIMVTKKNMNGNIGLPIMALELDKQDMAVLEAGIDFVGEMDLLNKILIPDVAVITNIGTSHIGKFGSRDIIYQEKTKIANNLRGRKILLVNGDDEYLKKYTNNNVNVKYYSINEASNIIIENNCIKFEVDIYNKKENVTINAIGNHNILNAIVAIRVAEIYNLPVDKIIRGVSEFRNFSRRMEEIDINGITLIDDTYNASPSSTESGLKTIDGFKCTRKIALLADIKELGQYAKDLHIQLGKVFKELNYDCIIAYGDSMKYLVDVAKEYVKEAHYCQNATEAESILRNLMKKGDIIYFKGSNVMNVNNIVENLKRDFMN